MYSPYAVANSFLALARRDGSTITNLKMQKLVYFAHGVYLAATDQPLINEPFEAWSYGPVLRSLYLELRSYGASPVDTNRQLPAWDSVPPDSQAGRYIAAVWNRLKDYTAGQLVDMTHVHGSPWSRVYRPCGLFAVIPDSYIKEFFTRPAQA